jgi:hypothetical protein
LGISGSERVRDVSFAGVNYSHLKTNNGGDLYLTKFGLPFREQLSPENWYAPGWFSSKRVRLVGTSSIYKVPTKPVRNVSIDLVVRFSRVGEEVPLYMTSRSASVDTEFNSPFEEFGLVMQLRQKRPRIFTKKPLAIFVPAERLQLWQTGRLESKIAAKLARNPEVRLDILRQYILLYGWIEGLNAVQVLRTFVTNTALGGTFLADLTNRAARDLEHHGFGMADIKPEHVILRINRDGSMLCLRNGELAYALVDYELLARVAATPSQIA